MSLNESRVKRTEKNILAGVLSQIVLLLVNFFVRSVFISHIGMEYLGVSGLFSNILNAFSIAEMGFGTAVMYSLYKPVAEGDEIKQAALMSYFKRIYNTIAVVVAVLGVALVPFLPIIINLESDMEHLQIYYLLYLTNTVMTYLFAYRVSIIKAHQRSSVISIIDSAVTILQGILQLAIIIILKNFMAYLVIQVVFTVLKNIIKGIVSTRMYPYTKCGEELDSITKRGIWDDTKSVFVYNLGNAALIHTDNILISSIVGTIWVGYYSNYLLIIDNVNAFLMIFINSVTASIGNFNASKPKEEQYDLLSGFRLPSWWLYAFCSICILVLIQDFLGIWGLLTGQELRLGNLVVIAAVLNLYLPGVHRPLVMFRDTIGMFRETKFVYLFTAALNIILSIILGRVMGISGIIFATSIARAVTVVWFEPVVIMKKYFNKSAMMYFQSFLFYGLIFIAGAGITFLATMWMPYVSIPFFVCKMIVCAVIPNVFFLLVFHKSEQFKFTVDKLRLKERFRVKKK